MRATWDKVVAVRFWRQFLAWDRPSRVAFLIALSLLTLVALSLAFGPDHLRRPALIGAFGLLVVAQAIFMWANRHMVMPYTRAQRLYLAEDFEAACHLLESVRQAGKADVRALTLLGNAYRQRNMLYESETVLREALAIQPNHYFSLYGFGRTLLVQGRYAEATDVLRQALDSGDSAAITFDAGEAYYRHGAQESAQDLVEAALQEGVEPHRQLMGQFLLYRMGAGSAPESAVIEAGIGYWQAQAERYQQTPYGQALFDDVRLMQRIVEETE